MTHYETLGITPEASNHEIRKAYLAAAKAHHPDKPDGDEAKFRAAKVAYETLNDADRRAAYDRGDPEPEQDQRLSRIAQLLQMTFDLVVNSMSEDALIYTNPLDAVESHIQNLIRDVEKEQRGKNKELRKLKVARKRLKHSGVISILQPHLDRKIDQLIKNLKQVSIEKRWAMDALELLNEYDFKVDPRKETSETGTRFWTADAAYQQFLYGNNTNRYDPNSGLFR